MITKLNPEVIAEGSITSDKLNIESLKTDSGFVTEDSLANKINGKGLSTEDFTTELKTKLEGLGNFDDTELSNALSTLRSDFDKLVSGDTTTAIKTFNEVIAFLDGLTDTQDLSSIIASIEQQIASKSDDSLVLHKAGDETITGIKTFNGRVNFLGSGDSNAMYLSTNTRLNVNGTTNTVLGFSSGTFLINNAAYDLTLRGKGTRPNYNNVTLALSSDIPTAVTESTVSGWGFTKNTGTYSKPSGGIPKSDLASAVQTSLGKADTALQSYTEQYKGTITGVSANGTSVATSGVANIPAASTSAYGVTKLSSATNSTSTTLAATASAVKAAYDLANSYKGTVTSVKINGTTKSPTSGAVDLGTVITSHQDISGKQDKLVSGTNIKTINGISLLGSGDIVISGGSGSSSGSGAYAEVNHGTSDTTFTLTPNTFHVWGEVSTLTLTFGSETSGVANEYLFQFTSGSTATTLSLPSDVKWVGEESPAVEANKIYQISILKGLGSILEWNNAVVKKNNEIYPSNNVVCSQYPVASDVSVYVIDNNDDYEKYITIPKGASQSSTSTSFKIGYILDITPKEDDMFYYYTNNGM